jgi:hypothetical protein
MNWIGRLLVGEPEVPFGRCPKCQGAEATRICSVVGWRMAGGRVETVETGARYSCQRCGEVYSVGPAGVFQHHALSLPPSPRWSGPQVIEPPQAKLPVGPMREEPLIPRPPPAT